MAEIFRVVLPVSNIDVAETFYADLLGQPGIRVSGGRHYFRCGPVILACYDPWADGDDPAGGWKLHPHQVLSLAVDDLDATLTRIRSLPGAHIDSEIETQPWGERSFYARDPFGNPLCFVDRQTLFTGESTEEGS
jgi:catechol 2,3-dioxygenase-like lactoylglutathione lyase family enzyme